MTDKEIIQELRRCQFGAPCARCQVVSNKNCMNEMHKYRSAIDGRCHEHYYSAMVILKDEEGKKDGKT